MARLTRDPIDREAVIRDVENAGAGAVATFAGVVRDRSRGRRVVAIDYHAYEAMAIRQMDGIEEECQRRWPELRASIVHRSGLLRVGEVSVFIAVSSPHRAESFEALRYAIDRLKETTPIWKKEIYPDGHAWIEGS